MSKADLSTEYLVISRGQWDKNLPPERIQTAIDDFYVWITKMIEDGKMKSGTRLANTGKTVSTKGITDGPYGETKEIIGGYWFIVANSLDEASQLASQNPCMQCGLFYEIRPLEYERASAYREGNETPIKRD
ncbi:MAG TPA: YciI family protein [Verrucomicrobiae bacterium]